MDANWDAFICHASEDKHHFVRPLAEILRRLGVSIWYDEFSLRPGDSLSRSIDRGIAGSSFGVVVISKAFVGKAWAEHELRGLVNRDVEEDTKLIPIWHGVGKEEVRRFSPSLSDKIAIDTRKVNAEEAAIQLLREIRPDIYAAHPRAELEKLASGDALSELQNQFDELRAEIAEYRCPYCGAGLVFRDRSDYEVDVFGCGYSTGGGRERPCPFGPNFPTLEEYDLQITRYGDESNCVYTCTPCPKTDRARSLDLSPGHAKTPDDARDYVIEYYSYLKSKPGQEFRGRWHYKSG